VLLSLDWDKFVGNPFRERFVGVVERLVVLPRLGELRGGFLFKTGFISCLRISLFLGIIAGIATATGDYPLFFVLFFLDLLLNFLEFELFSLSLRLLD